MLKEIYHYATFIPRNKKRANVCLELLGEVPVKAYLVDLAEQGVSHELIQEIKLAAAAELSPAQEKELLVILKSIAIDCKMANEIISIEGRLRDLGKNI